MSIKLLNLGCGSRYSIKADEWTNIDFVSTSDHVIAHNLLSGIPFEDNYFDVVYHSHVLEHFTKTDAKMFLMECSRVLKPGGIIRIAVPDLERIAREYIKDLELALQGNKEGVYNYDWIILELYDQMVRNESGGDMAKYLFQKDIPNEDYVFERVGEEAKKLRKVYFQNRHNINDTKDLTVKNTPTKEVSFRSITYHAKIWLRNWLFRDEIQHLKNAEKENMIGKFRLEGEIHQWMYDRYSLSKLLFEVGFTNAEVKDAFTSKILNWNSYELESKDGIVYKPDSLFMEAVK